MLGSSDPSELRHDVRDMHFHFLLVLFHSTNEQAMYFIFLLFLFFNYFFPEKNMLHLDTTNAIQQRQ